MARFAIYEAQAVSLVTLGVIIKDGLAKGTFVKLTMPEKYATATGVDGSVTRYRTNERVITVEVTVMNSSSENQVLSAIHLADQNATNGAGVGAFLLKDNNGATLISSSECWIKKAPDWEFGEEVKEATWTFEMVEGAATTVFGGNG